MATAWRKRAVPQSCQCNVTGFEQKITHTDIFVPACTLRSVQGRSNVVCTRSRHWRSQDCPFPSLFGQQSQPLIISNPLHSLCLCPADDSPRRIRHAACMPSSAPCLSAGQHSKRSCSRLHTWRQEPRASLFILICHYGMSGIVWQHRPFHHAGSIPPTADKPFITHINTQWDTIF